MSGWFWRALLATLLLQMSVNGIRPLVSYAAIDAGGGTLGLGIVGSAFAVLSLLVAIPIGRRVDRWGERWFIIAGAVVISIVSLALCWIDDIWLLAVSQAVLGLGQVLTVVGIQTLIANRSGPETMDNHFGVFAVVVSLGQLAGPATATLLAGSRLARLFEAGNPQISATTAFLYCAMLAAISALAVPTGKVGGPGLQRGIAPKDTNERYVPAISRVLRIPSVPTAMLASLAVLVSIDLLSVYLPAFGEARGLSVEMVGLLLGTRAAASMAARALLPALVRTIGRRQLLALSIVLSACCLAVLPFANAPVSIYVLMAGCGLGLGLGQPLTLAWVAGKAPVDLRGTAIGVRLTGNRLGQTVLPVALGALATGVGSAIAVFPCLALLLGVSALAVSVSPLDDETHQR